MGSDMAETIALFTFLIGAAVARLVLWRHKRRLFTVADLKGFTVSRQWLIEHQTDEW